MSYVLITDSSADLPWGYYKEHNLPFIPLTVTLGDSNFPDNGGMPPGEFFDRLRKGEVASTSMISMTSFTEVFEPYLKEGKDILYLGLSSGLSGSYDNACQARDELLESYPGREVYICNTFNVSLGLGLMVHEARVRRDEGLDFAGLRDWCEETKLNFIHLFTVDDLMFLHRGGRVSKASAVVGSLLGIKPMLHVSHEGRLINHGKVRGRRQSLTGLVDGMAAATDLKEFGMVTISHGDCESDAVFVMEENKKRFTVRNEIIHSLGTTIGAHSGPGTVALFFLGRERTE